MTKQEQKVQGKVYTPDWIIDLMLKKALGAPNLKLICDPACGTGNFILKLLEATATAPCPPVIHGFDIDRAALRECRRRLRVVPGGARVRLHHANALARPQMQKWFGKFDLVIGNPPYIKIQNMDKTLAGNWPLAQQGATDAYLAFMELGLALLGPHGTLSYITPSSYLHSRAARRLRQEIHRRGHLKKVVNFGAYQVFPQVTTYPVISVLTQTPNQTIEITQHAGPKPTAVYTIPRARLATEKWTLVPEKVYAQLTPANKNYRRLEELAEIMVGVQTLADRVFILPIVALKNNQVVVKTPENPALVLERASVRPIIKGSTVKDGAAAATQVLITPYTTAPQTLLPEADFAAQYPQTYAYLKTQEPRLRQRDKGNLRYPWYAFGREINLSKLMGPKIITSPINKTPNFLLCPQRDYVFYSGYGIKLKSSAVSLTELLKQLNSPAMAFYIKHTSKIYQQGWHAYSKNFIKDFPVRV